VFNNLCIIAPNQEKWVQDRKSLLIKSLLKAGFEISEKPSSKTDLNLCVGGDGSLLAGIRSLGDFRTQKPISGIHCSNGLGFLHPMVLPSTEEAIDQWVSKFKNTLKKDDYELQKRWGLEGKIHAQNGQHEALWAMNDLVFSKGRLSRMVKLRVSIDKTVLFDGLRGDGLIAASATGSTAYSFSAGGPVIAPELSTILLTPICSHDIAQRPVVLGPDVEVEIEVLEGKGPCFLTEDGQSGYDLGLGDKISVTRSKQPLTWWIPKSAEMKTKNHYEQLRHKLGIGGKI